MVLVLLALILGVVSAILRDRYTGSRRTALQWSIGAFCVLLLLQSVIGHGSAWPSAIAYAVGLIGTAAVLGWQEDSRKPV